MKIRLGIKLFLVSFLFIILSIGLIIAPAPTETLIGGKVYASSDLSSVISGATVNVECGSASKSTSSSSEGEYVVRFDISEDCKLEDEVKVTLSGLVGEYSGSASGSLSDDIDSPTVAQFAVINVVGTYVNSPSSGGSGGSSRCTYNESYDWKCSEWNVCVDGSQTRTCNTYNNCGNTYGRPALNQSCGTNTETTEEIVEEGVIEEETQVPAGAFSRITGAVTGAIGTTGGLVIVVFIVGVAGSAITVRQIRKRKNIK